MPSGAAQRDMARRAVLDKKTFHVSVTNLCYPDVTVTLVSLFIIFFQSSASFTNQTFAYYYNVLGNGMYLAVANSLLLLQLEL